MSMAHLETIYMPLLDEGVSVWRPVEAAREVDGSFRIVSVNDDPEDEHWRFSTGELVRCEMRALSDRTALVAVARWSDAI